MIKVKILYKLFVKCFGRRCKDYYPWCPVCEARKTYDILKWFINDDLETND